jgi:GMP synthase-like glutamine amidotransferase
MKITVFQTGLVPEVIRDQFDGYGKMIADLIDRDREYFEFEIISPLEGDVIPKIDEIEGLAISGSALGVYDDAPWMEDLRTLIRDAYAKNIPMVGICFGHQLMAEALGAKVEKSQKGWGLGRHSYKIEHRPDYMSDAPAEMQFSVVHQDQVLELPQKARLVGGNEFAPYAMLDYENGAAFSIQAHPEFADEYTKTLFEVRKGHAYPVEAAEAAIDTIDGQNSNALMGSFMKRFFLTAK